MIGQEWKEGLKNAFAETANARVVTESRRIEHLIAQGTIDDALAVVRDLSIEMYGLGWNLRRLRPRLGKDLYMSETAQRGINGICGLFFDRKDERYQQLKDILFAFIEDAIREALGIKSISDES